MQTNFEREKVWWNAKAAREDEDRADEAINRALRWLEIERHLAGVRTILAVGGGTGAFSIPLAQRGFEVTHLDLSPEMLALARERARGLSNVRFVEGNAVDLSRFHDQAFDLVLNMDGAISFCGSQAERAVREGCRVTGGTLIVTVSHRARMAPVWVDTSLAALGRFSAAVTAMLEGGDWTQEQFPDNAEMTRGLTQDYLGTIRAFLPGELRTLMGQAGLRVLRCGGLGSLAGLCRPETVERVLTDPELFEEFVALCDRFDKTVLPDGPGTCQRAGLIGVAVRPGP